MLIKDFIQAHINGVSEKMTKPITIFNATRGLNTKIDPARVEQSEDGIVDLTVALNIDIGTTGRISRRKGFIRKIEIANPHSLYCDEKVSLFVADNHLQNLGSDYSSTPLLALSSGDNTMRYVRVVDAVYFCNGVDIGVYRDEVASQWIAGGYHGVVVQAPPTGTHIEHFKGRIYVAKDTFLYYSEPFQYDRFNYYTNVIPFGEKINMIRKTVDGLYVGTDAGVYFLAGDPTDSQIHKVSTLTVIDHTDEYARTEWFMLENVRPADCCLWSSTMGVCVGLPSGQVYEMTQQRIDIPPASSGCSLVDEKEIIINFNV